jgi:hypothetical protein
MGLQHALGTDLAKAAQIARVPAIDLVGELPACQVDLLRIDHDHVVTHVEVRRIDHLVLAPEHRGHLGGQPPQHLIFRVDQIPLPLDVRFARHYRRHGSPSVAAMTRP